MKTITRKVFSLSSDFTEEQSNEIVDMCGGGQDIYTEYTANSEKVLKAKSYENDSIANRLIELGCEEDEKILIHIDY